MKTLWEIAVDQFKESDKSRKNIKDSVFLLVGNKKGGKSTICYKFLERSETPKSTLALEYVFGRRSKGIETGKEICHIWELGGGTLFLDLLEIPITVDNLRNLSVVLTLDLSKPEELWYILETLLTAISKRINNVLSTASSPELKNFLNDQTKNRIPDNHEDSASFDPFPVPLLIIGTKYDLFQTEDFEKKKLLCKCLRYVAHSKLANLLFVSSKSESLVSKARASISSMVFGTSCSKTTVMDNNKPLYICAGADSFQSIGSFTSLNVENKSGPRSVVEVKKIFCTHFPQVESKSVIPDDPAADSHFKEPDIDNLRTQKKKELLEYKRKKETKRHPWD